MTHEPDTIITALALAALLALVWVVVELAGSYAVPQ